MSIWSIMSGVRHMPIGFNGLKKPMILYVKSTENLLFPAAPLGRTVHLAPDLAFFDVFALVVQFFALPQGELHLHEPPAVEINIRRHQRKACARQKPGGA